MMISRAMGARQPGSQGERAISVKTIAQGMPDDLAEPVVTAASFFICWRAMGEAFTRHSLRPLRSFEGDVLAQLGRISAAGTHNIALQLVEPLELECALAPLAGRCYPVCTKRVR